MAAGSAAAQDRMTILAVFAHPDDETTVGAALAKYADEGHEVYLTTLTSGQAGNANTDIPKGPELGRAREAESRCSAAALGIHEPFLLGFQDGATAAPETLNAITAKLTEVFERVKPDVVITWGPDGLTGHPDHRVASNLTTQIFQASSKIEANPRKLYYVAMPAARIPPPLHGVDEQFITTKIDARAYGEQIAASVRCHETQWSPERMNEMIRMGSELLGGNVHLRLALSAGAASASEDDLLSGL